MKTIKALLMTIVILTFGLVYSCQPGGTEDNDPGSTNAPSTELSVRIANMLHLPFEVTSSNRVNVSAKVTVLNGQLNNVKLYYTVTEGNVYYGDIVAYSVEEYAKGRIEKSTNANLIELVKRMVTLPILSG